jgi:hypothetical protein
MQTINQHSADEDLIAFCQSPDTICLDGTEKYSNRVVKVDDEAVIKFGRPVTIHEFKNLKIAKALVDPDILYVPEAHRFFTDQEGRGYILMEYVHGTRVERLEDPLQIQRVAGIVEHLLSIRGDVLGTLGGGPCGGVIFPDTEEYTFQSIEEMQNFFNKRLFPHNPKLDLEGSQLVLCHMDVAPRNMIFRDDGSICFIDWAWAGFYPRCLEYANLKFIEGRDGRFTTLLLEAMTTLPEHEEAQCVAFIIARGNSMRYHL